MWDTAHSRVVDVVQACLRTDLPKGFTMSENTQISTGDAFENLLHEERRFPPSEDFAANAIGSADLYEQGREGPEFWARQARELLTWHEDFSQALDWSEAPFAKWFVGGRTNLAYNCLDRHIDAASTSNAHDLVDRVDLFEINGMVNAEQSRHLTDRPTMVRRVVAVRRPHADA